MKKIKSILPQKRAFDAIYSYIASRERAGIIKAIEPHYIKAWVRDRRWPRYDVEVYIHEMGDGTQVEVEWLITRNVIKDLALGNMLGFILAPIGLLIVLILFRAQFDYRLLVGLYIVTATSVLCSILNLLRPPRFITKFVAEIENILSER